MTWAWDREKIWESNPWPPEHRACALSTNYENSWKTRSFNWVRLWQASCILLGSIAIAVRWSWFTLLPYKLSAPTVFLVLYKLHYRVWCCNTLNTSLYFLFNLFLLFGNYNISAAVCKICMHDEKLHRNRCIPGVCLVNICLLDTGIVSNGRGLG